MDAQINPWSNRNLDEFLYYCCPECDSREKCKEMFLEHALKHHPNADNCFLNVKVKLEEINTTENL